MKCVAFIDRLQGHSKEIEYVMVYKRKMFEIHFNNVILLHVSILNVILLIRITKLIETIEVHNTAFPIENSVHSISSLFTKAHKRI